MVPESWSHVIGVTPRAVDEIVSAVRMSRIRVLLFLLAARIHLGQLQRRRLFDYSTKELELCLKIVSVTPEHANFGSNW